MSMSRSDARHRVPSPIGPPIEYWPAPRRAIGRRAAVVAVAVIAVVAVLFPAGADGSSDGLPWTDFAGAQRLLADAEQRRDDLAAQLVDIDDQTRAAREQQVAVDGESVEIADDLRQLRSKARTLAVESYMTGGAMPEAVYLLDAPTANDFAFRSTLLSEGADAVADSTEDYYELRALAGEEAVALSVELDRLAAERARTERRLAVAETALVEAGAVVAVAEVHDRADALMASSGRVEPSPQQWQQVRECESLDNYEINTGNGFFGAYQFELQTWVGVGGTGLPNHARPQEQDARARLLYSMRGAQPWPLCGRFLPGG